MNKNHLAIAAILATTLPASAMAEGRWESEIGLEARLFSNSPLYAQQQDQAFSATLETEYYHEFENDDGYDAFTFKPYLRIDTHDEQRSHADIRELNWLHVGDEWESRIGIGKVFWGVAETRHLVDIINQTDSVEDTDGEDKLGQQMASLIFDKEWGQLQLFVLPGFREQTFSGDEGRLRGPLAIDEDQAQFESSSAENHIDYAIRYQHVWEEWDYGISQFYGTSREARINLSTSRNGSPTLVPYYDIIAQTGLDVQATYGGWLWKLEAIHRVGQGRTFQAATGGLEYTFFTLNDTNMDLGIIAEYHWDDRDESAPETLFDQDIFLGARLALNDPEDTALLAGALTDVNDASTSLSAEFSRRIGDNMKLEIDVRLFTNADENNFSYAIREDDHVQIRIAKYF
jgi:hypothetical protein